MATKYNILARIPNFNKNTTERIPATWFKVGYGTENKNGQLSIKILGLPLPGSNWDGWLYVRDNDGFHADEQAINDRKKELSIIKSKSAKNKNVEFDDDDDIPF